MKCGKSILSAIFLTGFLILCMSAPALAYEEDGVLRKPEEYTYAYTEEVQLQTQDTSEYAAAAEDYSEVESALSDVSDLLQEVLYDEYAQEEATAEIYEDTEYAEYEEYADEDDEFFIQEDVLEMETESNPDDGELDFDTMYFVNPEYEGLITVNDLVHEEETGEDAFGISTFATSYYTDSIQEAGLDLRQYMEERETSFTVKYHYPYSSIDTNGLTDLVWQLWDVAFEHTGVPTEGDYMRWQYGGWGVSTSASRAPDGGMYLNLHFTLTYYSTLAEEQAVTQKLNSIFSSMNLGCKNDYERVKAIYDYICENVTYDYANLNNSSYLTKFSAYGALINGTAVCQGYAVLFYRMCLEAGVDCRVITGSGNGGAHGWNIVGLNGLYYNTDATWDAGYTKYDYFLLPDSTFKNHVRGSDYSSSSFYAAYPMSTTAYDPSKDDMGSHHTPGEWVTEKTATCTEDGLRTRTCTVCGEVVDSETVPAYGHDYISETTEAGCETEGFVVMVCKHCEDTYISEIIPPKGHQYKETVMAVPDCTHTGYSEFTCTVCGDVYDGNYVEALGHQYKSEVIDGSCTEQGWIEMVCSKCGESYIDQYTAALGHDYDENGVCTRCGAVKETETTEHVHNYIQTDHVDSTCSTEGFTVFTCECGEQIETIIPATGIHSHELIEYEDSSCMGHGWAAYECSVCGDTYIEDLPLGEHEFGEAAVTLNPDCDFDGAITFTCLKCGHSYEDAIPALGHEPVENEDGAWICERCGTVVTAAPETEDTTSSDDSDDVDDEFELLEFEPLAQYDINDATITGIEEEYIYTGTSIMPKPVVTYDGKVLEENVDYILIYAHVDEVGYASISIVGIGNYTGDVTFHFTIEEVEHGDMPDSEFEFEDLFGSADQEYKGSEKESESESESETETEQQIAGTNETELSEYEEETDEFFDYESENETEQETEDGINDDADDLEDTEAENENVGQYTDEVVVDEWTETEVETEYENNSSDYTNDEGGNVETEYNGSDDSANYSYEVTNLDDTQYDDTGSNDLYTDNDYGYYDYYAPYETETETETEAAYQYETEMIVYADYTDGTGTVDQYSADSTDNSDDLDSILKGGEGTMVQTGDETSMIPLVMVVLVFGAAIAVNRKKRYA